MILEFKDITKGFKQGNKSLSILKSMNFQVETPRSVAILGKSGSGKSTFLSLGSGLDRPESGDILIHNESIINKSENELAKFRASHIGIIFQQFHLMQNLTAYENIILPLEILKESNPQDKVMEALEKVGLADRMNHFPHQLSGGEKQRVAIARALVTKPNIIFADEPSGNLDSETGSMVMELLFKLVKESGTTLLLVTHDLDLAKKCDEMFNLIDHKLEKQ
jgi:putative ABC transport system ATP-binding protein